MLEPQVRRRPPGSPARSGFSDPQEATMSERGGEAAPSRDPAAPATADGPCRRMEQAARGLAAADRWCREAGEDALQAALEAYRAAFARYSAAYEACREERRRRASRAPAPTPHRPAPPPRTSRRARP